MRADPSVRNDRLREDIPPRVWWYGRDEPPPERIALRAGPLTAVFEDGDLRYVRLGDREIVRRVYVAVRDPNWNTILGRRSDVQVERGERSFRITYASRHVADPIVFAWRAFIEGAPDGTISFAMDGAAEREFRYCRIGFCILHPAAATQGRAYRAETPGGEVRGVFPRLIEPQRIENGVEQPLVPACSRLAIDLGGGIKVDCAFEGDLFEVEDQRNWTDASFKTYCTPLALGCAQRAVPGRAFRQRVVIRVDAPEQVLQEANAAADAVALTAKAAWQETPGGAAKGPTLTLGKDLERQLPKRGVAVAADGGDLSAREEELLRALRLDHLRVELRLWEPTYPAELARAARQGAALGCALELALFVTDDADAELRDLAGRLSGLGVPGLRVARVLVFHEPRAAWGTTEGRWVRLARGRLGAAVKGAPIGGGTNGNPGELYREPPEWETMDCVSFTANPQVHAFDEATIVENLETLPVTVETARAISGDRDIVVSRLTLKPPFNQAATEPEPPPPVGELPSSVDPRQMSLFAAGWAVGSFKYLGEAGAASVTLGETVGWRGLLERPEGSPCGERFSSRPGMVFPIYHVLADLAAGRDATLSQCVSSDPLAAIGLALRRPEGWLLLIANLTPEARRVRVVGARARSVRVRILDATSAPVAAFEPERFRASWRTLPVRAQGLDLDLAPFAVACLEARM
jgi:hypothetical protein